MYSAVCCNSSIFFFVFVRSCFAKEEENQTFYIHRTGTASASELHITKVTSHQFLQLAVQQQLLIVVTLRNKTCIQLFVKQKTVLYSCTIRIYLLLSRRKQLVKNSQLQTAYIDINSISYAIKSNNMKRQTVRRRGSNSRYITAIPSLIPRILMDLF